MKIEIEISEQATEQELEYAAWKMFCIAHPHEAFGLDPDKFWKVFQEIVPGRTRLEMEEGLLAT